MPSKPFWRSTFQLTKSIWNTIDARMISFGAMEINEEDYERKKYQGGQQRGQGDQPGRAQQPGQQTPKSCQQPSKPQEDRQFEDDKSWEQGSAGT